MLEGVFKGIAVLARAGVVFLVVCPIGWMLNLQNLWEYWPTPLSQIWYGDSLRFLISLLGVFVVPLGVMTGFMW